jgi:uncharacterized membrane protein
MEILKFAKFFHVFFLFLWLGSLVMLFNWLKIKANGLECRKHYFSFQLPCMLIAIFLGIFLLINSPEKLKQGWFHMKLTGALALIVCDIWSGRQSVIYARTGHYKSQKLGAVVRVLTFVFLLLTLAAIYVIKK